ncbi:MAG TPA: hypothetical protein VFT50_17820 [Baekduia sp.]|nr:hypothetical protein [Baekduia sp.]
MPTEPEPLTLSEVVRRAVEAVDPNGGDQRLADLLVRFEDRDEPISAVPDIEEEVAEATRTLDVEGDDPALTVAGAVITYLAFRRGEVDDDPERLIRLATDAEFNGNPPPDVTAWLESAA